MSVPHVLGHAKASVPDLCLTNPCFHSNIPCSADLNSLFQNGRVRRLKPAKAGLGGIMCGKCRPELSIFPVNFPVSREFGRGERFDSDCVHSQPPAHGPLCGEALRKMARRRPLSGLYRHYKRANRAGNRPTWREFGEFSLGVRMVVSVAGTEHRSVPAELHTDACCCCQLSGKLSFNNSTTPPRSRRRPSRNASTNGGARNANCMTLLT